MPETIAIGLQFVSAYFSTYTGVTMALATAQTIVSGAILLGGMALSARQASKAKRAQRDAYNAAQVDRLANVVTTTGPRELVLGRVRKGGAVAFRGSTGTNKDKFLVHLALAGHEIDAVEQVYFNDEPVTLDANGYVLTAPYFRQTSLSVFSDPDAGTTSTGYNRIPAGSTSTVLPYTPLDGSVSAYRIVVSDEGGYLGTSAESVSLSGSTVSIPAALSYDVHVTYQAAQNFYYARVRWDLGAGTAVADARTAELFPGLWGSAHRGQGIAKLVVEFTYDETAFPSGVPNVTAVIRGAKVYDPRSATTAWSDNPALLARHVYQHAYFGKAAVSAAEDARFNTAANACETSQTWTLSDGTSSSAALYRAGLVASYGAPARELLDDLAQAMGGMWAFGGGELFVRAGVYTASVKSFTDSDLATTQRVGESEQQEQMSIAVHRERAQKFNTVNLRIWDGQQDYKQVPLTPVKSSTLITRDGQELAQEVTLSAVSFAPQAQHIAGVMMRDARDPLSVEAPFKMTAYPVEVFDTVAWTSSRYGWTNKTFMVLGRRWDRARGVVWLTLKETAAAIYTPDAAFLPQGYAANTSKPSPWNVSPPSLLAANIFSGTDELVTQGDGTMTARVRVTWPALTDSSITQGGFVDVEWTPIDLAQWQRVTVTGDQTQAILQGPADGRTILIRARSRNSVAVSNWSLQIAHTVVGKTAPPASVSTFTIDGDALRWSAVDDVDLAGYLIRFNYGNNTFWDSAAPLHTGVLTDSPYTIAARPEGRITILIKAVDTSGNVSTNAAAIVTDLGDAVVENILFDYPEAPTFTGTITSGAISGGTLQAANTDLFYGDNDQPFYGADTSVFYDAGTFAQMVYQWSRTPEAGGRVVLSHTITGADYGIEYLRDSQEAFYAVDADLFYGADADAFYGAPGTFATWPGEMSITAAEAIGFRITTAAGPAQGVISEATVVLDVPDVNEELQDIVIASGGTRLPITQSYRAIKTVQITVQADGNNAITARIADKNATTGPLIYALDAAGSAVTGLVDASIRGY